MKALLAVTLLSVIIGCKQHVVTINKVRVVVADTPKLTHFDSFSARHKIVRKYDDSAFYFLNKEADAAIAGKHKKVHFYYLQLKRCLDTTRKYNY